MKKKYVWSSVLCILISLIFSYNRCFAAELYTIRDKAICNRIAEEYRMTSLTDEEFERKYGNEIEIKSISVDGEVIASAYAEKNGKIENLPVEIECKEIDVSDYSKLKTDDITKVIIMSANTKHTSKVNEERDIRFGGTMVWIDNSGPKNELLSVTVVRTGQYKGNCTFQYGPATNAAKYCDQFAGTAKCSQPSEKTTGLYFKLHAGSTNTRGQIVNFNMSTGGDFK